MTFHDPKGKFCKMSVQATYLGKARRAINGMPEYLIGDKVGAEYGAYNYRGEIRSAFTAKTGQWYYVVEGSFGGFEILTANELRPVIEAV